MTFVGKTICPRGQFVNSRFFGCQTGASLGRSSLAWAASAQLAGPPELGSFFGKPFDLVGVDKHRPRGDLLRPDQAALGHRSEIAD
jgi:hypothetical protein